jgi:hypothetical protein
VTNLRWARVRTTGMLDWRFVGGGPARSGEDSCCIPERRAACRPVEVW